MKSLLIGSPQSQRPLGPPNPPSLMASFSVSGSLHELYDTQQVNDRFKKREFVVEIQDGQYSEYIKFQAVQERTALLDSFQKGDTVTVHFNLKGRPYDGRNGRTYFTNLDAWKVEGGNSGASQAPQQQAGSDDDVTGMTFTEAGDGDLPF